MPSSRTLPLGMKVVMGEQLGEVGVAGSSGGWSHLHYKVLAQMPSGKWGNEDMYAYLLDAWTRDNDVELIACARPHRTVAIGERVILSAKNTWSSAEADLDFYWTMPDGSPLLVAKLSGPLPIQEPILLRFMSKTVAAITTATMH